MKFYVSSQKSKILHFDGLILSKSCTVSAKKVQYKKYKKKKKSTRIISHHTEQSFKFFKEKLTFCLKNDMRYLMNLNLSSEQSEDLHFYGIFLSKVCNVWAKII